MTEQDRANLKKILIYKTDGSRIEQFNNYEDYKEIVSANDRFVYELSIGQTFDGRKYMDYLAKTFHSRVVYGVSTNREYEYTLEILV